MSIFEKLLRKGESPKDQAVRKRLGTLGASTGVGVNVLLALMKVLLGTATGSVAITADAANNLSDAGGSVMSLVSMRLAQKPVDREHPYGHGRIEYIGALGVGMLILLMGFELLKSGITSIIHPTTPTFGWLPFGILVISILMKFLLFLFYKGLGTMIDASSLLAAAKDSLSDVLATSAVAISMIVSQMTPFPVDGIMGVVVALLVLKAGFDVVHDQLDTLLGAKTNPELGKQIVDLLTSYDLILGTHDLMIHDYGPGRCIASVHAEVPADGSIVEIHEVIDQAEQDIARQLNIPICIHMDPVVTGDPTLDAAKRHLNALLNQQVPGMHVHDLRMVPGEKTINLVFDVAVPGDYRDTAALTRLLSDSARELDDRYHCVVHYDIDIYGSDRAPA